MDDAQIIATVDLFGRADMSSWERRRLIAEMRRINALSEKERRLDARRKIFRMLQIPSGRS